MWIPLSTTAGRRRPVITLSLILLNTILFLIIYFQPSLIFPNIHTIYEAQLRLALIPVSILRGERLWTLLTHMFMHGDFLHLFGNMIFLFFFGAPVESAMGRRNFTIFYLLCGFAAVFYHMFSITLVPREYLLTQITLDPWITPVLGASGAISGIMAAYLIYYPRSRITTILPIWFIPLIFTLPAWAYVTIWFLLQLVMGLMTFAGFVSSIAYWAHIGGFLTGLVLAPVFLDPWIKERISLSRRYYSVYEYISDFYIDEEFF